MASPSPIKNEAFPLWLELTGVDPSHFRAPEPGEETNQSRSYTLSSYDATQTAVQIYEALALDDGELTAQLLMLRALDEFMEGRTFTLSTLVRTPERLEDPLRACKQLLSILHRPALVAARERFTQALSQALVHYSSDQRQDVKKVLADTAALATLRRDALGSLDRLRMSQFLKGEAGGDSRPKYSTVIRRWWNVEHMLAAHALIPEGVSLNLLATPVAHDVFFCFVVRRGANLYVLDDAAEHAHPLQSQMSRRPDRRLADRIARFWFPYDLADVKLSEDGSQARVESGNRATMALGEVGTGEHASQVIGAISDLPASELLWTVMMFDLIHERFWSAQPLPQLDLSYVGSQLKEAGNPLLELAGESGLPVVVSPPAPAVIKPLSVEQVAELHLQPAAEETLGQIGPLGHVAWIEERFSQEIPAEALNHVSSGDDLARLTHDGRLEVLESPDRKQLKEDRFFRRDTSLVELQSLSPVTIGTAENLSADRAFLARYNYARSLAALAQREFDERKHEIEQWLDKAYKARAHDLMALVPAAVEGIRVHDWAPGEGPELFDFVNGSGVRARFGIQVGPMEREPDIGCSHLLASLLPVDSHTGAFERYVPQGKQAKTSKAACQVTGASASYLLRLTPTNSVELAWLLGMEVSDLPDVLQCVGGLAPGHGNQILNRIDPMLWALPNPWQKLHLGARLGVSKRGLAQLKRTRPATVGVSALDGVNTYILEHGRVPQVRFQKVASPKR